MRASIQITTTIQAHLVHFAPGEIIQIIGEVPVMWIGISMFIAHSAVGLAGKGRWHFGIALMLSGIGWNMLFTTGTALLVGAVPDPPRVESAVDGSPPPESAEHTPAAAAGARAHVTTKLRLEGMNELCVRLLSMVAAALAGILLSGGGWDAVQLVALAPQLVTLVFVVWFAFASHTWCCQRYQCPTPKSFAAGVMLHQYALLQE